MASKTELFRLFTTGTNIPSASRKRQFEASKEENTETKNLAIPNFFSETSKKSETDNKVGKQSKKIKGKKTAVKKQSTVLKPKQFEWFSNETDLNTFRKQHKIKVYGSEVPQPLPSFSVLQDWAPLPPVASDYIASQGISEPSGIQMQAIPVMMSGRDLLACAPTGTGKTLAFLIPLLLKIQPEINGQLSLGNPKGLVIAPTRELAQQITREARRLFGDKSLQVCSLKKTVFKRKAPLSSKYDIIVTTPLRLLKALEKKTVDLSSVEQIVFDEADKLLDLGFLKQIDGILAACTKDKLQQSLFSATIPSGIESIAQSFMKDPIRVTIGNKGGATECIDQKLKYVGNEEGKIIAFKQMITEGIASPSLIFTDSVERANHIYNLISPFTPKCSIITSKLSQEERECIMTEFRLGNIWFLVTTDLLARGIDFKFVQTVINYDFPENVATYIHRIGRTGRGGKKGCAVTFFKDVDSPKLKSIATVLSESGCPVPDWMLALKKGHRLQKKTKKKMQ